MSTTAKKARRPVVVPLVDQERAYREAVEAGKRREGFEAPDPELYGNPRFVWMSVDDHYLTAYLSDGRVISLPLRWSWRLEKATQEQRDAWEIIADGRLVTWAELDEDIYVGSFFFGSPAPRPKSTRSATAQPAFGAAED